MSLLKANFICNYAKTSIIFPHKTAISFETRLPGVMRDDNLYFGNFRHTEYLHHILH